MKFPNMEVQWYSRFTDFLGRRQYEAFHTAYVAKVQPLLEAKIIRRQDSKDKKTSAVTKNKRLTPKQMQMS